MGMPPFPIDRATPDARPSDVPGHCRISSGSEISRGVRYPQGPCPVWVPCDGPPRRPCCRFAMASRLRRRDVSFRNLYSYIAHQSESGCARPGGRESFEDYRGSSRIARPKATPQDRTRVARSHSRPCHAWRYGAGQGRAARRVGLVLAIHGRKFRSKGMELDMLVNRAERAMRAGSQSRECLLSAGGRL